MTTFRSLVSLTQKSLDAVTLSFSPPAAASSQTIRLNGLICILVGMLCVILFGALVVISHAPMGLALVPSLLAYAFFTVGGYRVIRGKEPAAAHAAETSLPRILLGCVSVIFCVALLIGMALVASVLFEK
jgi:hypothetical protein